MIDELQQITDNVWIFPHDEERVEANVGVICSANQTILIDAGNSPRHGRRIALALQDIDAPPVTHLIYTHHHWDHTFGAMTFDVPIIAHAMCFDLLKEAMRKPWSQSFLHDEILRNPLLTTSYGAVDRAISEWRSFRIQLPTVSFSDRLNLYVNDIELELVHVGGRHAPDSIVVSVEQEGVIFLGDCFYPPPSYLQTAETGGDYTLLKSILTREIKHYIDGHSSPFTRKQVEEWLQGIDKSS